ncbi:MAG: hypothetical protein MR419_01535 [Clostridiales bacterium]|nr:hypothetical protein [Clostridiales bacterium]MDY4172557.1 hypothetical protein [Evtepia sp.]
MRRRFCWLGAVVAVAVVLCACHPSPGLSLEEQIEQDQNLPAGSVTLVSEGVLESEEKQAVGFFDQEGNPGLAVFSKGETPRLLSVEPASSFFSRVPETWTVPVSFGGEICYVFLSNNPDFTCLKVRREGGQWEEIPVPPPPSLVSFSFGEANGLQYRLCDPKGNELQQP